MQGQAWAARQKAGTMTVKISVVRPEDRDREFLADIAPFFMRQDVRKALPYLKDTPEKTWLLAREGGEVVGIAGIIRHKNGVAELCSLYIEPAHRGRNIAENLVARRLAMVEGARVIRVVCAPASAKFYTVRGMRQVAKRGSYIVFERKAEKAA